MPPPTTAPKSPFAGRDRVICGRFLAGESVAMLADDYALTRGQTEAILRAGLRHKGRP